MSSGCLDTQVLVSEAKLGIELPKLLCMRRSPGFRPTCRQPQQQQVTGPWSYYHPHCHYHPLSCHLLAWSRCYWRMQAEICRHSLTLKPSGLTFPARCTFAGNLCDRRLALCEWTPRVRHLKHTGTARGQVHTVEGQECDAAVCDTVAPWWLTIWWHASLNTTSVMTVEGKKRRNCQKPT